MNILEVEGIYKSFDGNTDAVQNVSFHIPPGCICGFIGPNGAGKTTTMRICATLEQPDQGDVKICGYSVLTHPREARNVIGFMPDLFPIEPTILVADMLEFFGRAHGLWGQELAEMMKSVIEFTGIEGMLSKAFQELSKGMKQRAALATVLMHDPKLLILDEPAAGLDPRARVELRQLLKLLTQQGKSVLISSHILAELTEVCDQFVVLEKGKVMGAGKLAEFQRRSIKEKPLQEKMMETPAQDMEMPVNIVQETIEITRLVVKTLANQEMVAQYLQNLDTVSEIQIQSEQIVFCFEGDVQAQSTLLLQLVERGFQPIRFAEQMVNLEDVFMSMTEGKVQ